MLHGRSPISATALALVALPLVCGAAYWMLRAPAALPGVYVLGPLQHVYEIPAVFDDPSGRPRTSTRVSVQ